MWTASQIVEDIITRSPFLAEAIAENITNNSKIARRIKPEVEEKLLKKVSEASISMALHRLEKRRLQKPQFGAKFLKQMNDITVRSNLIAFVCPNSVNLSHVLETLSTSAAQRENAFLIFSRGLRESLFIVGKEFEKEISEALKKQKYRRIEGLSAITSKLPEESLDTPGVYYPILRALALEGISLVEVTSVRTEYGIIFRDKDVDHAFSVIKRITS